MTDKCFGIYFQKGNEEKLLTNFSKFSFFIRGKIGLFLRAGAKEIIERSPPNSRYDLQIELDGFSDPNFIPFMVGVKNNKDACFIFTFESRPHSHLIVLAKNIIFYGLKDSIIQNFDYIKTEIKYNEIHKELDDIKDIMINNIDFLLQRGEILEDLVEKTEHLTKESKKFYKRSKKLNKKCCFF